MTMKRLASILIVLVLLVVAVTPAFASGKNPNGSGGNKHDAAESVHHPDKSHGQSSKTGGNKPVTPGKGSKTNNAPAVRQEHGLGADSHGKSATAPGQLKKLAASGVITPTGSARAFKSVVAGGTILAVDPISGAVTLLVQHGNARAQAAYSETVTVTLSAPTRYQLWTPDGAIWGDLTDLEVGQNVMLKGWTTTTGWSADWLKVGLGLARKDYPVPDDD